MLSATPLILANEAVTKPEEVKPLQSLNHPIGDHFPFAFDVYLA